MDSKLVVLMVAAVGVARAGVIPVGPAPLARLEQYDPLPQYSFGYDVQDALTGDYKTHQEKRNGDIVQGSYSVVDPDGTRRIVDYAADPLNGFNAVVRREPLVLAGPAPVVPAARFVAGPAPIVAGPAPVVAAARLLAPPAPVARFASPYPAYSYPAF